MSAVMYQPSTLTLGRLFLTLNSIISIVAPYIADFNETHVYNPNWPGHARFHNGQTMSMGVVLGLLTLYLTYRSSISSTRSSSGLDQVSRESADTFAAALAGTVYWITGLSAILYPGAKASDPEFGDPDGFPQLPVFVGIATLAWVGWFIEERRLRAARQKLVLSKSL